MSENENVNEAIFSRRRSTVSGSTSKRKSDFMRSSQKKGKRGSEGKGLFLDSVDMSSSDIALPSSKKQRRSSDIAKLKRKRRGSMNGLKDGEGKVKFKDCMESVEDSDGGEMSVLKKKKRLSKKGKKEYSVDSSDMEEVEGLGNGRSGSLTLKKNNIKSSDQLRIGSTESPSNLKSRRRKSSILKSIKKKRKSAPLAIRPIVHPAEVLDQSLLPIPPPVPLPRIIKYPTDDLFVRSMNRSGKRKSKKNSKRKSISYLLHEKSKDESSDMDFYKSIDLHRKGKLVNKMDDILTRSLNISSETITNHAITFQEGDQLERQKKLRELAAIRKKIILPPVDIDSIESSTFITIQSYFRSRLGIKISNEKKKKFNQRTLIMDEIISTEKIYIQCLSTMIEIFYTPLTEEKLITDTEISALFGPLEIIFEINNTLLEACKEVRKTWNCHAMLGPVFIKELPMMRMYVQYVNNYNQAMSTLAELKKKKHFSKWLNTQLSKVNLSTLEDYLITPVQRIPRYTMLISEMLKMTDIFHPDHDSISKASSILEEISRLINEKKREAESVTKMIALQESMIFNEEDKFDIAVPGRKYVSEIGAMININGEVFSHRHIWIFSDIIIITKPKKTHQKFHKLYHTDNILSYTFDEKQTIVFLISEESYITITIPEYFERQNFLNSFTHLTIPKSQLTLHKK